MMVSLVWFLFELWAVTAQDFENGLTVSSVENPRPVFLLHGVFFPALFYEYLAERIKLHNPRTVVLNSKLYEGVASLTPLQKQIDGDLGEQFRNFSKNYPGGINVIGHSQGALLTRLLIQSFPEVKVSKYISIAGPQGGVYGFPFNFVQLQPLAQFPPALAAATALYYTPEGQANLGTAGYWKDPTVPELYLSRNTLLPYYNNEILSNKSESYKQALLNLDSFITIFGSDDGSIWPYGSGDFSYYNRFFEVVNITEMPIYTEDRLGIRALVQEGKFIRHNISGVNHIEWIYNNSVIDTCILPYLD